MDTLLFRYNNFSHMIVVAATTGYFLQSDIQVKLLCDENGEAWMSSLKSEIVAAFLAVHRGVGMQTGGCRRLSTKKHLNR